MGCEISTAVKVLQKSPQPTADVEASQAEAKRFEDDSKADFQSKYLIGSKLGKGGFSVVYEAVDRNTFNTFAVKIISRVNSSAVIVERQINEVEMMRKLNHKNIVNLTDYFEEPDNLYIVMELMEGGDVCDRIVEKQTFMEKEVRDLIVKLLDAVEYCHSQNYVHRDIKPENLLLSSKSENAEMKVADFGIACEVHGYNLCKKAGTVAFMAPEIHNKIKYGKPVDMWSIGVTMFLLLGGYLPFDGTDCAEIKEKVTAGKIAFPAERWSYISQEAIDFIKGLLKVDMFERFTVSQALKHPWVDMSSDSLSLRPIPTKSLREYHKSKFRKLVNVVIAMNRFSKSPREEDCEEWKTARTTCYDTVPLSQ